MSNNDDGIEYERVTMMMMHKLTCRTCLNCSSKLHPLFCCDEFEVSLDVDEFEPAPFLKYS
jgi:hypothetical protein